MELNIALLAPVLVMLFYVPAFQAFDWSSTPLTGNMEGGDYPIFWFAGHEANAGRTVELYDAENLKQKLLTGFGAEYQNATWLYPPHILMIYAPLQKLNYSVSWLLFIAATYAGYLYTVYRTVSNHPRTLFFSALAPACFINIIQGQTGFLAATCLIGAIFVMHRRPVVAGILLGCLTIKPQVGILVPFILLLERQYLSFAWATITAVCLVALSVAWFGLDVWVQYLTGFVAGTSSQLLDHIANQTSGTMVTLYGFLRALGQPHPIAMMSQGILAVLCLATAYFVSRAPVPTQDRAAIYVVLCYLVSPYIMNYDLLGPAVVGAMMIAHQANQSGSATKLPLAYAAVFLPVIQIVTEHLFIPSAVILLVALACYLVCQIRAWRPNRSPS